MSPNKKRKLKIIQ